MNIWRAFWGDPALDAYMRGVWGAQDRVVHLQRSYHALRAIVVVQVLLLFLWNAPTSVPGFCVIDVTGGEFNAISHTWFWMGYEIFVVGMMSLGLGFNIGLAKTNGLMLETVRISRALAFAAALYLLALAANITHVVACATELAGATSTLSTQYPGYLIGLIVLLGILLLVEVCALYYIAYYRAYLRWSEGAPPQPIAGKLK